MRCCLDIRTATPHYPGIGRYVRGLAQGLLVELSPAESLYLLAAESISLPAGDGADPPLSQIVCRASVSPFSLSQQWRVPALLRRQGAALYHSPYYLMPYRPGVPAVLTVYDLIPLRFPHLYPARTRFLFRLANALALRTASRVIAISESTRRDYIQTFHLPEEKISTIPLACDETYHPQPEAEVRRVRERYGLQPGSVLAVSSNKPHKNLVGLVEAWSRVVEAIGKSAPHLVIAGAWDPRYPQARRRATELGLDTAVHFLGPVPEAELPALYSGAEFFVFPSLYEGFGLPVLEAMACGAPVICGKRSGLSEAAGEAALFFNPASSEAMSKAILELLADPAQREALRQKGLAHAGQFSWRRTARATLRTYRQAVRREV